ncbi:hypothetical protein CGLO_08820 [Colletotrichum gloeosporioides Cg-14]|uniref:Uncharacterized protein n=1 Tax=Colletotrichum gloeosporioides (strain Cg-14) TaxID=1237896 RepID=T0LJ62_COLGC|nr:hypothetical protein CGLO_08820 [Colletotrichum gloeosporioides Cg-14]
MNGSHAAAFNAKCTDQLKRHISKQLIFTVT